jgi:uncharacterized protein (TIGR03435 family)
VNPRIPHLTIVLVLCAVVSLGAQTPRPTFDVVSVKPAMGDTGFVPIAQSPGRFAWTYATLKMLIGMAYQRHAFDGREIVGGPDWIDRDHFDVLAQADPSKLVTDASGFPGPLFEMMRAMLADRFRLQVHAETRELPIYVLTRLRPEGKLGPRMTPSDFDCAALSRDLVSGKQPERRPDGMLPCAIGAMRGRINAATIDMRALSNVLGSMVARPVVDKTGLTGAYDVSLEFMPDFQNRFNVDGGPGTAPAATDAPSIFTAVQEQLGLKLDSTRGPVDVIVVDHAEPPTPN